MIYVLCVIGAGALWGCMGILTRTMNEGGFHPLEVTAFRAFITAVLMTAFLLIFRRKDLRIKIKDIWIFIGTGIVSVAFFNICYFTCMTLTTLSNAAILLYTAPAFVTILSVIIYKDKMGWRKIVGIVLALMGCVLVSGGFDVKEAGFMGILTGLGAGIGYALYSIFARAAVNRGYSSFTVTAYTFIFASAGCLPFVKVSHMIACFEVKPVSLLTDIVLVFFNTIVAYLLYTKGLDGLDNSTASVIACVEPVVATLVGFVLFKERPGMISLAGMILVLSSCVLVGFTRGTKKKKECGEQT